MSLLVAGAAGWWLWHLHQAPNRTDLATFWQLVVAVVALPAALAPFAKDWLATRAVRKDGASDRDRLADAVERQWTEAAESRRLLQHNPIAVRWTQPEDPMAASAAAACASTRFQPLPGIAPTTEKLLSRGGGLHDLHAVYGGLRSGRLVIAGAPGSGKSGAAVLLLLDALRHRHCVTKATDRGKIPVPVLLTFHNWNPDTQPVRDWLVSQLHQTYPDLFNGRRGLRKAARLIDTGGIAVIVDGLDEIPAEFRPLALQALSGATFRLIILSRSKDMCETAEQAMLEEAVAVELRDVGPKTAADYLTRIQLDPPPPRWRELTDRLRNAPDSPIARALSNPLTLTLIRDTYRSGDSIGELLDFCATGRNITREDVENYLLDRVLPQAYARRPGAPKSRYTLKTAQHTLQLIASRMHRDSPDPQKPTRDLAWWCIPTWIGSLPRTLTIGIVSGLVPSE